MAEQTPSQDRSPRPSDANKPKEKQELDTHGERPEEHKSSKRGFFLTVLVVVAVLIVVFAAGIIPRLRSKSNLQKEAKAEENKDPDVVVAPPSRAPQITTLRLPANIQAVQETDISARASGFVQRWNVDIGDQVRRGQVMAVISTPDVDRQVDQARAQVTQAQAQLIQQQAESARAMANLTQSRQNAERQRQLLVQGQSDLNLARVTADRWRYLVSEGAVSQQSADQQIAAYNNNKANVAALQAAVQASQSDIDAYQAALLSSQANVNAARANVTAARANLRRVGVLNAFKVVRAPFSGVVTSRSVDAGSFIGGSSGGGGGATTQGTGASGGGASSASGAASSESGGAGQSSTQGNAANSSRSAMYGAQPDAGVNAGNNTAAQQVAGQNSAANQSGNTGRTSSSGGAQSGVAPGSSVPGVSGSNGGASNGSGSSGVSGTIPRPATGSGGVTITPAGAQQPFQGSGGGADEGIGGAVVSPGTSLYHIAKTDAVRIQVNVPQTFVPNIRVGGNVSIYVREFPRRVFYGRIARTAAALDLQTRTLLTEIVISNSQRQLLPGMFAQVEFKVPRTLAPLIVPSGALLTNENGTQLAVVDRKTKKVHLVSVSVGRDYGRQVEITSGIQEGDMIVQDPSDAAREGVKVNPVNTKDQGGQGGQNSGKQGGGQSGGGQPGSNQSSSDLGASYGGKLNDDLQNKGGAKKPQ